MIPIAFGNPDPDWQENRRRDDGEPDVVTVEVAEAYPTQTPRRYVWGLLLVSTLLVLHVQRDRYIESMRWHGGIVDDGPPLPWEMQALVSGNDTFEATFLAPSFRRASNFLQLPGAPLVIGSQLRTSRVGKNGKTSEDSEAVAPGVSAFVVGAEMLTNPKVSCSDSQDSICHAGVQRASRSEMPVRQLPGAATCHRFVTGKSPSSMQPLTNGSFLCLRSKWVHAAVATSSENSTVFLAWEPRVGSDGPRIVSCLASVSFPSMQVTRSASIDFSATVLFDKTSNSIITVGFSGSQNIVIDQFDADTLRPRTRFSLPLSVAWLLHASRVSEGYVIFLGSELPFVGTLFAVDLRKGVLYQQDPPSVHAQKPRRWVLPGSKFIERLPDHSQLGGPTNAATLGPLGVIGEGPCAAATVSPTESRN